VSGMCTKRDACLWDAYQWDEKSTSGMRDACEWDTCERRNACDACEWDACEWDACQSYAYRCGYIGGLGICVGLESAHRWVSVVCACVASLKIYLAPAPPKISAPRDELCLASAF
jgi:hypothetical protein